MSESIQHFGSPARGVRRAIGFFAAVLALTLGLSIRLSTLQAPFGSVIFGSHAVWRAHTASFRVAAFTSDDSELLALPQVLAQLRDERGIQAQSAATGSPAAMMLLPVPADLEEYAWLDVWVTHGHSTDFVSVPLHAVNLPGLPDAHIAPATDELQPRPAPVIDAEIRVYPHAGHVVGGLQNTIWGRLMRGNKPWQAHLESTTLAQRVDSDALGLFHWRYRPTLKNDIHWVATDAHGVTADLILPLQIQPTQLLLNTPTAPWVNPHAPLQVDVTALPFRDPVALDLWAGDCLLSSVALKINHGYATATLPIPQDSIGLLRLSAFRMLLAPRDNAISVWLWPTDPNLALQVLSGLPGDDPILLEAQQTEPNLRAPLIALALSRLQANVPGSPLLKNSVQDRKAAFDEELAAARRALHLFFASTMLAGLALATSWAALHQRDLKRSVKKVMQDGFDAGEDIDPLEAAQVSRVSHRLNLFLTLVALVLAVYGLLALLAKMRWA